MEICPDTTPIANPSDHGFSRDTMPLYLFSFGAYGCTHVYAWGCHTFEDAFNAACEWLRDNAPGVFVTFSEADYAEAARDIGAPEDWNEPGNEEWAYEVMERAEVDHTYTESGYLASWEWYGGEVHDPAVVARVQWRSREGTDEDMGDYWTSEPDHGPVDCAGSEA